MDESTDKTRVASGEAYISGALTALEDAPRTKLFYELLAEIAGAAGLRPYLPHRVTDPVAAAHLDPRAVIRDRPGHVTRRGRRHRRTRESRRRCGIEVELAREHAVP